MLEAEDVGAQVYQCGSLYLACKSGQKGQTHTVQLLC